MASEASNMKYPELSETQRFPMLSEQGRRLLYQMRQHPCAPIWNWPNGEQLTAAGLERVQQFAGLLNDNRNFEEHRPPDWLADYVARCLQDVPYYRNRYKAGTAFEGLPTTSRADLAPRVWEFVPDSQSLKEVIVFSSSGTTSYPTRTAHHPYSAACGIPILEWVLRSEYGISIPKGPDQVAVANFTAYRGAYTTAIVVAYLKEAGCIRVNIEPSAWRSWDDCPNFVNHWQAPIWLADPVSLCAMEKLSLNHQPSAILSSILQLNAAYRDHLQDRFSCPVIDLYAMTEAGIIAFGSQHGHRVIPHDLHVEILDTEGRICPMGVRGEITLTGGRNPFLPLLRYRTGDYASLEIIDGQRELLGLQGRELIEYSSQSGRTIHSMEVARILRRYPVVRYEIHPGDGQSYQVLYQGDIDSTSLADELSELFGQRISVAKF